MNNLEINGRKFLYRIEHDCSEYGYSEWTDFYILETVEEKVWSWRKFRYINTGKLVKKKKKVFTINFDIHNPRYTKSDIREKVEKEVELLNRAKEIERGEII